MENNQGASRSSLGTTAKLAYMIGGLGLLLLMFFWGAATIEKKVFPYQLLNSETPDEADARRALENIRKDLAYAPAHHEWAKKVVQGGYILHFRHAQREKWEDVTAFDAYEILNKIDASQASFKRATCLTEQGVEEAKLIGEVFRMTKVKVSRIVTSPICRSWQTAQIAWGRYDSVDNSLVHRTAVPYYQHEAAAKKLRGLMLGMKPPKGENYVLSGHGNTLMFDGKQVIDIDETIGGIDNRSETGFIVIENVDGKLIARHKFRGIRDFAGALLQIPMD
jgi:hypothetical protein